MEQGMAFSHASEPHKTPASVMTPFLFRRRALWLRVRRLIRLLQHLIQLLLLVVVEEATDLGNRALANGVDFLNFFLTRESVVIDHGHGLRMLILKNRLHLALLLRI